MSTDDKGGSAAALSPERRGDALLWHIVRWAGAALVFAGLVLLLYAISAHEQAGDSDRANVILEGLAMGNGHVLLHGWTLTFASYWSSDAPFYSVAIALFGLRPGLLYIGPAVMAALTIAVGALIAREGRRRAPGLWGSAAVVALLAFATPALSFYFVARGFHIATELYALVAFAALRRGRFGWGWVLAVILIAVGMIGDLLIVAYAAVPLLLAGLVAASRERKWASGIADVSAVAAGVALGVLARLALDAMGAFAAQTAMSGAGLARMLTNLGHVPMYLGDLTGLTNGLFSAGGAPLPLRVVHVLGALCMMACFVVALASLLRGAVRGLPRAEAGEDRAEHWRLDDILVIGMVCGVVPFVVLVQTNGDGVRYLTATVVFAAVLTGRTIARAWPKLPAGWVRRSLVIVGVVLALGYVSGFGYAFSRPVPQNSDATLVAGPWRLLVREHHDCREQRRSHREAGGDHKTRDDQTDGEAVLRLLVCRSALSIRRLRLLAGLAWQPSSSCEDLGHSVSHLRRGPVPRPSLGPLDRVSPHPYGLGRGPGR
jgi:hypothetical protein